MILTHTHRMTIAEGFPGQRMLVLPRPRVREALQLAGTSHLVVTDCGYFPEAQSHGRSRNAPIQQAVVIVCAKGSGWCETDAGRFEVVVLALERRCCGRRDRGGRRLGRGLPRDGRLGLRRGRGEPDRGRRSG